MSRVRERKGVLRQGRRNRWRRSGATDVVALLVLTAIPLFAGAVQSGFFSSSHTAAVQKAESQVVAGVAAPGEFGYQGALLLTESPASNEFVSQSVKRSKQRAQKSKSTSESIASDRSGLTRSSQPSVFSLFPSEGSEGGSSVFPAVPGQAKKARTRLGGPTGTYRTLCVRLCDGYYWPVSYATTSDGLVEDKDACESSCGVPVKLFYYQNPDGTPEEAVDLKGERYASLANAFRYRNEYVDSCKCQPHPWEAASLKRHQNYAALVKEGKLALYDNRKPKKGRRKQILVGFEGPTVTRLINPQAATAAAVAGEPKTTVTSLSKKKKRNSTLVMKRKGNDQVNFGTAMGITKVGKSASGQSYSAKKTSKTAAAFQSRK